MAKTLTKGQQRTKLLHHRTVDELAVNPAPGVDDLYNPVVPVASYQHLQRVYFGGYTEFNRPMTTVGGVSFLTSGGVIASLVSTGVVELTGEVLVLSIASVLTVCIGSLTGYGFWYHKNSTVVREVNMLNREVFVRWLKDRYSLTVDEGVENFNREDFTKAAAGVEGTYSFVSVEGVKFFLIPRQEGFFVAFENPEHYVPDIAVDVVESVRKVPVFVGEKAELWSSLVSKVRIMEDSFSVSVESKHALQRVKTDMDEVFAVASQLKKLKSGVEPSELVVVLEGLNKEMDDLITAQTDFLTKDLKVKASWIHSRQKRAVESLTLTK